MASKAESTPVTKKEGTYLKNEFGKIFETVHTDYTGLAKRKGSGSLLPVFKEVQYNEIASRFATNGYLTGKLQKYHAYHFLLYKLFKT